MESKRRISIVTVIAILVTTILIDLSPVYGNESVELIADNSETSYVNDNDTDSAQLTEEEFDASDTAMSVLLTEEVVDDTKTILIGDEVSSIGEKEKISLENDKAGKEDSVSYNGFYFTISYEDREATVVGWDGEGVAEIPSSMDWDGKTYPVTTIEGNAFLDNADTLTGVVIPASITNINSYAFKGCKKLKRVELPSNMKLLGNNAFDGCELISYVKLPDKLDKMGNSIFKGCLSLNSIKIPKNMEVETPFVDTKTYIAGPFSGADNLKIIEFEEGFDTVPQMLFVACNSIEEIELPAEVTQIGNNAFRNCKNLELIKMSNAVRTIGTSAFDGCSSLKKLNLSQILNNLGTRAFYNCTALSQCTIPDSIDVIGESAFEKCGALEEVRFVTGDTGGSKNGVINKKAFFECKSLKNVSIPNSFKSIGESAFEKCTSIQNLTLENRFGDITFNITIGSRTFAGCTSMVKAEFRDIDHLKAIGGAAFQGCSKLEELILPNCVETIGGQAFENCISLENVVLSKNLNTIGAAAFRGDVKITSIEIPKSVTDVKNPNNKKEDGVFWGCNKLETVKFETGIEQIPANILWGTYSISKININTGVNEIGKNAFRECVFLENAVIPNTVITIGDGAFYGDKNLVCPADGNKLIPEGVKTIGNSSFYGCKTLSTNILPEGLEKIGNSAFEECVGIRETYIPNTVTVIGTSCFKKCEKLTDIHLPDDLTKIPDGIFQDCTALVKVNLSKDKLSEIGSNAFNNCNALVSFDNSGKVDFSEFKALEKIKEKAFQECDNITAVKFSAATTEIGKYVFDHCQKLSDISLGTGLSIIPEYAFSNLNALVEMIIPRNVSMIKAAAFEYDPNLEKVQISKETELERGAFTILEQLTIWGPEDSPAHEYAKAEKINWHTQEVYVQSINYVEDDEIIINMNQELVPVLKILPVHYTVDIGYESDDESIFTVDSKGKIKGVAPGIANLKATASSNEIGGKKSDSVRIRVKVPVSKVTIEGITAKEKINLGDKRRLTGKITPDNASVKEVTWSSSDESVIYVDSKGTLIAKKKGPATITVTSVDNPKITATCTVEVVSNVKDVPDEWTKPLNAPMADPKSGDVARGTHIRLSCMAQGADIYYTLDGSEPVADYTGNTSGSTRLYTGDIVVTRNTIIKAFAICPGYKYSNKAEYLYTVDDNWGDIDVSLRGLFGNDPEKIPDGVWFFFDGDNQYYTDSKDTKISKTYTGEKITLDGEINVFHGNSLLVPGRDYKVTYSNNINIAPVTDQNAPAFTIKGSGNYSDKKVFKFAIITNTKPIEPGNVSDKDVDIRDLVTKPVYTGNTISAGDIGYDKVTLLYKGTTLNKGDDYDIDMSNATAFGKFDAVFRFKGKYTGNIKKSISVQKYDFKKDQGRVIIKVDPTPITFSKAGATPGVSVTYMGKQLKEGVDYKLTYSKNKAVTTKAIVKVVGKGCFKGTKPTEFEIIKAPVSNVKIVVDDVKYVQGQAASKYFVKASKIKLMQDGKNVKSSLEKLKDSDLKFFDATTQKEISSSEVLPNYTIIEVRATLKAKGDSPFTGTSETLGTYRIIPEDKNIKSATVTIKDSYFADGEELVPLKSSDIEVRLGNAVLPSSEYDIISVTKNRFVGTGRVTIAGRNEHGGTKTKTFKIRKKTL